MENMRAEAKRILAEYGDVIIRTVADETKVAYTEEAVDEAFDFSELGFIEEIVSVS